MPLDADPELVHEDVYRPRHEVDLRADRVRSVSGVGRRRRVGANVRAGFDRDVVGKTAPRTDTKRSADDAIRRAHLQRTPNHTEKEQENE